MKVDVYTLLDFFFVRKFIRIPRFHQWWLRRNRTNKNPTPSQVLVTGNQLQPRKVISRRTSDPYGSFSSVGTPMLRQMDTLLDLLFNYYFQFAAFFSFFIIIYWRSYT